MSHSRGFAIARAIAVFLTALTALFAAPRVRAADPPSPGNVLVSLGTSSDWEGFAEFSRSGVELRRVRVPSPPAWQNPGDARDLAVDDEGRIVVYYEDGQNYLSTWDPTTETFHHATSPDPWTQPNVTTHGGLDVLGDRVFATDPWDYRPEPLFGVLVYDRRENSWQRFAEDISPADLNIGLDGLLYAVHAAAPPGGRYVSVYDPKTLELVRRHDLAAEIGGPVDNRTVVADRNGDFFVGTWNGWLHRFDADGRLVDSVQPPCEETPGRCRISDMDISEDGELVFGTRNGIIFITDREFSVFNSFEIYTRFVPFVAWVPETPLEIAIEVRPDWLFLHGRRPLRIEVYGDEELDVRELALEELRLGPGGAEPVTSTGPRIRDMDGDGFEDRVLRFRIDDLDLGGSETELCLTGSTESGRRFEGCDDVHIAGACGRGGELAVVALPVALWWGRRSRVRR